MTLSNATKADLWLIVVTILAAISWIFSKEAVLLMPPLLFISSRFILAGIVLSIVGFRQIKLLNWHQYKQAIAVGSVFAVGMCFWIMGLYSGVSLSVGGFLTSLAVVISPALARVLFKEAAPFTTWLSMPVAAIGLGFLSLNSGIEIETGQLFFIAASFFFALFFILNTRAANHREIGGLDEVIDISEKVPTLSLTAITLLTVGVLSGCLSFAMEEWDGVVESLTVDLLAWVLASAFIGTAARFFIQTHAQSLSSSSHGVVIMVVEPIWTALLAAAWFGERLSGHELIGCSIIFVALIIIRWSMILNVFKSSKAS
ncbi:MAG TPA: DMT family transporter [Cycloclasticus sp.]|jgi:drug/metabolite transporter (DMT)-like permease|nr:DMT family transporter [Cycloclasticus sp.]HIL91926.1 DMT family transporter [Cycloclasticus sp.]